MKIDKNNTTPMFTNYCDKRIKLRNLREKLNLTKYIHGSINTLLNHNTIIYNRLEKIVLEKFSLVRQVKEALESYGIKSLVSGSGPTVFGLLNSRKEAELIREKLSSEYDWQIFLTRTC